MPDTSLQSGPQDEFQKRGNEQGYLVDYYAILNLERGSPADQLQSRIRELLQLYFIDKVQHLGAEIQTVARRKTELIVEAREILLNPERKASYDRALEAWEGPVSRDGNPIIVLGQTRSLNPLTLLADSGNQDAEIKQAQSTIAVLSGFDPELHKELEAEIRTATNPSPAIKRAYAASLRSRELHLSLLEMPLRQNLGLEVEPSSIRAGYLEATQAEIEQARHNLGTHLAENLLDVRAGTLLLKGATGEAIKTDLDTNPEAALAKLMTTGLSRFDALSEKLADIANQRDENLAQIYAHVTYKLLTPADQLTLKLVVVCKAGEEQQVLTLELSGEPTNISVQSIGENIDLTQIDKPDYILALKGNGLSVLVLDVGDLELNGILQAALVRYMKEYQTNASSEPSPGPGALQGNAAE